MAFEDIERLKENGGYDREFTREMFIGLNTLIVAIVSFYFGSKSSNLKELLNASKQINVIEK